MPTRRALLIATAMAVVPVLAASPLAAIGNTFTFEAFDAAQKAGRPIIVEIGAAWCPVCQVQRPIVEDIVMSDGFRDMVYLEVDFDKQKDVLRRFNAAKQSTLIVFKGATEVGRSIGDTRRASIEALMAKAL